MDGGRQEGEARESLVLACITCLWINGIVVRDDKTCGVDYMIIYNYYLVALKIDTLIHATNNMCVCVYGGVKFSHNYGLDNQTKGEKMTRVIHSLQLVIDHNQSNSWT